MTTFNADLIEDVAQRRLVIFAGAGVSASAKTRSGAPIKDWPKFLDHAADTLASGEAKDLAKRLVRERDYLMACEIIKRDVDDPARWSDLLHQEFSMVGDPSELHRAIANLRQRVTVTTNFDKLLENTWAAAGAPGDLYPVVFSKLTPDSFKLFRDEKDYIIKIHGSIDDPESLIFARGDYSKHAFSNWIYSDFINTLFVSYTVMFVGFSMDDPAITQLIEVYGQKYPNLRPHYIVQPEGQPEQITRIAKDLRRLYIVEFDNSSGDYANLPKLLNELAKEGANRRKALAATYAST
jgi:hypothetical protein